MTSSLIVFTGKNAILPDCETPCPATIIANQSTGKITHLVHERLTIDELDAHVVGWRNDSHSEVKWIDAGDNFILPGLVEYASERFVLQVVHRPLPALMSTLMNLAGRIGKDFTQEQERLPLEVSPPW
jgi:hypothetical protein